jgi:hypothetical protein
LRAAHGKDNTARHIFATRLNYRAFDVVPAPAVHGATAGPVGDTPEHDNED